MLGRIREILLKDLYVRVEGPAQVALFAYDNDTFIVESFLPKEVAVRIVTDGRLSQLRDVLSGEELIGEALKDWRGQSTGRNGFAATLPPHSFRVFRG